MVIFKLILTEDKINGHNGNWETWPPTAPEAFKRPKVLAIEDHITIIMQLMNIDISKEIDMMVCRSLEHVLNCNLGICSDTGFHIENFDYILVDFYTYGKINGIEFISCIPLNQRHKCIPFSTEDNSNLEMISLGADGTCYGKTKWKEILRYILRDFRGDFDE